MQLDDIDCKDFVSFTEYFAGERMNDKKPGLCVGNAICTCTDMEERVDNIR